MSERPAPGMTALDAAADDLVLPFAVEGLDVRGRLVRLGPAVDAILSRHAYPESVACLLAESIALTVLLGSALKFDGRFILQTQSDGPVNLLVVDMTLPGSLRAYAGFDAARLAAIAPGARPEDLLGQGHLAMTVDRGAGANRYQGVVPLDGRSLEEAAHLYFRQSEQIPTRVRLAAARSFRGGEGQSGATRWRAGGLLIQHLPGGTPRPLADLPPGDVPDGMEPPEAEEPDEWAEARLILATLEDHELIDPSIAAGDVLVRLYHERGVRVFEPSGLVDECRCSRERIVAMLEGFPADDRAAMVRDGRIVVTCEFCSTRYDIDPSELGEA